MFSSQQIKLVVIAAIFTTVGMSTVSDAAAGNRTRSMDHEIQMCVAEVGRRADYGNATRVVHKIMEAEQKNIAEQQFTIDTIVFTDSSDVVAREYRSRCVTRGALKLVNFEINQAD